MIATRMRQAAAGAGSAINYLLNFVFPSDVAAPLPSPYTEVGSLTTVDTGSKISITSGRLRFASVTGTDNPRAYDSVLRHRTPGRVLSFLLRQNGQSVTGWGRNTDNSPVRDGVNTFGGNLYIYDNGLQLGPISAISAATDYTITIVQRNRGAMIFISGGVWTTPRIIWVSWHDTTVETLKAIFSVFIGAGVIEWDNITMLDYGGEWTKLYPYADHYTEFPTSGDAVTAPADGLIGCGWKVATGETFEVSFRRTDDNNRWVVRASESADTIKIIEINAGVETERASAAIGGGGTAAGDLCRITVRYEGASVKAHIRSQGGSGNGLVSYASATFNQSATGSKISGPVSLYEYFIYDLDTALPALPASGNVPYYVTGVGDSKTFGSTDTTNSSWGLVGYVYWMTKYLSVTRNAGVYERPARIHHSGYTTAQMKAAIDTDITARRGLADAIVVNVGVNDLGAMPVQATFETNYAYILDALHTKWPDAQILITYVWGIGQTSNANTLAGWIDNVLASRPWAVVGADERVLLENGDNGATYMADGVHPNTAGHQLLANAYLGALD